MSMTAPVMQAVRSMSSRQAIEALNTSNDVAHISAHTAPNRAPRARDANAYSPMHMPVEASIDGRRERYSVTTPPLNTADSTAITHAMKGGLYGMSPP